jgi:two-component system copper resistance phosphate regulon response regulator CusR
MFTIGLAEDDLKIAQLIKSGLEEHQYQVITIQHGDAALVEFLQNDFSLVILDVLMPGMNGMEVCRILHTAKPDLPILLLTALSSIDDKITGFDSGADDYLVKPFHFQELLVRIQALIKRSGREANSTLNAANVLKFQDISLNTESKEVERAGQPIALTAKEFTLLELFLRNQNRLLSRQYIAEKVWDINFDTGTNVIDVYVNLLRNKIDKGFDRKVIHTKINMGYILK